MVGQSIKTKSSQVGTPVLRGAEANTPANSGVWVATGVSIDKDSTEMTLVAIKKASGNRNSLIIVPVVETKVTGNSLSSGNSPAVARGGSAMEVVTSEGTGVNSGTDSRTGVNSGANSETKVIFVLCSGADGLTRLRSGAGANTELDSGSEAFSGLELGSEAFSGIDLGTDSGSRVPREVLQRRLPPLGKLQWCVWPKHR